LRGGLCGDGALGNEFGVALLGTGRLEGKGQALFVFERSGDAMQLPDQLVKLAGATKMHLAMVQEANCQNDDNRQADTKGYEDESVE
jgi:hypothetical protein